MNYFLSALKWLTDSANWWGPSGIGARLLEHVILTLGVVGIAAAIALPIGIVVGHTRRGAGVVGRTGATGTSAASSGAMGAAAPGAFSGGSADAAPASSDGAPVGLAPAPSAVGTTGTAPEEPDDGEERAEGDAVVADPVGLHARPAALFVRLAGTFESRITVNGASGASVLEIMSLGVAQGDTVHLTAVGEDARAAIAALTDMLEQRN